MSGTINASSLRRGDLVRLGSDIAAIRSGVIAEVHRSENYVRVTFEDGLSASFRPSQYVVTL